MTSPLVSVIIPNYNHARYLDERIQSVLNQTYQNFEVIILDDCSTDNSREVIEQYRDNPKISQIVYNEQNSGRVFKQWKKGITMAKGDLIWIAESDDKCELSFLERLVRCFNEHENLTLAFCRSLLFNDEGEVWTVAQANIHEDIYTSSKFIKEYMSQGCIMQNASSCLFSRKAFCNIDDRYTSFKASGDYMFWTLISEQGDIAFIDVPLNHYRKHNSNTTKNGFQKGINQTESKLVLDYILEKGYITRKKYKKIEKEFLRRFVFEYIEDKKLKKEIYDYWHFGCLQQISLKIEAYYKKIFRF